MLAEHGATAAVLARLLSDAAKLHADGVADGHPEGRPALPPPERAPAGEEPSGAISARAPAGDWQSGAISAQTLACLRDVLPRVLAGVGYGYLGLRVRVRVT